MSHLQSSGQQLSVDDLPVIMEELNDARAKWYDIGLQLRLSVGTLDAIMNDAFWQHLLNDALFCRW